MKKTERGAFFTSLKAALFAEFRLGPFLAALGGFFAATALILSCMDADSFSVRGVVSRILTLSLIFFFLLYFGGKRTAGRPLRDSEAYLVVIISALYIGGSVFVKGFIPEPGPVSDTALIFPASILMPTALLVMLPAILVSPNLALLLAFVLPLGAFFTGSFDSASCFFALVSGAASAYCLRRAQKRMDLVKAGLKIALVHCVGVSVTLLSHPPSLVNVLPDLFMAAFNGAASGVMLTGLLPPLEYWLNALTPFRLIELSDLNSPILRKLFTAAPGTYSHSLMVANLAEAACQDIGANALLARVGAYYHDIGKMEQPDYFVENQSTQNRHDALNPRLSATVIRSHVKLGVEKAGALGLPREVLEIIAEHHGNSVITWFYNKALKKEAKVNIEDFSYPGEPPRSRESAVVMLADVTEAATRTLQKPTAQRLEAFIQQLIDEKVKNGQLARSDLSFRDLDLIKKAFVRVLAGHYHTRIEYPKIVVAKGENPHEAKS
ncbi:MAG: HDIG domain-containing protein [Treponema sp.]|jgi:putative nucleotidyltransferase with HDIG domain|nr:HDIG domain-containing protein [Treponema sp.]